MSSNLLFVDFESENGYLVLKELLNSSTTSIHEQVILFMVYYRHLSDPCIL